MGGIYGDRKLLSMHLCNPGLFFALDAAFMSCKYAGMSSLPTPQDLEIMAIRAGITMAEACRRAGLTPSAFHRWKTGKSSPTLRTVEGLQRVLAQASLPSEVV